MRAAIIDIGSNSIRYMAGEVQDGRIRVSDKLLTTTRLAHDLDRTGELCSESMNKSLIVITNYCAKARKSALGIFAYATSAVRDASNGAMFIGVIEKVCGIRPQVLSGELEAELARRGATGDSEDGLIDIGGGSAQVISASEAMSVRAGCVRAKEMLSGMELDTAPIDFKRQAVYDWVSRMTTGLPHSAKYVGVGGTLTTLAALKLGLTSYSRERVNGVTLTREYIWRLAQSLDSTPDLAQHPLLTARHDVIIPGALVAEALLRLLGADELTVSDADGMEGYLLYVNEISENS